MLLLIGQVARVSEKQSKANEETGELEFSWKIQIQHTKNDQPNSELVLANLKAKSEVQAEAFRKCIGKNIRVPVNVYAFKEDFGFWIDKDTVPTLLNSEPLKVAA